MTFASKGSQIPPACQGIHRAWSQDSISRSASVSHPALSHQTAPGLGLSPLMPRHWHWDENLRPSVQHQQPRGSFWNNKTWNDWFVWTSKPPAVFVKKVHVNDGVIVVFAGTTLVEHRHWHLIINNYWFKKCTMQKFHVELTVCIFFCRRVTSLLFGQDNILRNSSQDGYLLTRFSVPWIFSQSPFSTVFLMWLYTETICATGFLQTKKERSSWFESTLSCFITASLSIIELWVFSSAFRFFWM